MNETPPVPELLTLATGATVALHDYGGDGPDLFFSHATGFSVPIYEVLISLLTPHHRVFGIDYRGHGWSPAPVDPADFGWHLFARDVLAVFDRLGVVRPAVVAHSMGAAVALLAEKERPGVFSGGFLYEPITWPVDAVPVPPTAIAEGARRRREVFSSRAEAFDRFASRPPFAQVRADGLRAYLRHGLEDLPDGTVRLRCRSQNEALTYEGEGKSTVDGLDSIQTRFTIGMSNPPIDASGLAIDVAESLPNARLVRYDRLGHFGPLQDPDLIAHDALVALRETDE